MQAGAHALAGDNVHLHECGSPAVVERFGRAASLMLPYGQARMPQRGPKYYNDILLSLQLAGRPGTPGFAFQAQHFGGAAQ